MNVHNHMTELIGKTPMLRLDRIGKAHGVLGNVIGKLEFSNPGGSVKDRIALNMIEKAEKEGNLDANTIIIEPTSGNTGIGLASIAAARGYKIILTMPESMSIERRRLLGSFGAEIVLTESAKGMRGAIDKANEWAKNYKKVFIPSQFDNPANPEMHKKTTAVEIIHDMDKKVDAFVAGVGTGGTITGVGNVLKSELPDAYIVAVEPSDSPVLSGGNPGPHKIQGIGAGFIPKVMDVNILDEIIQVSNEDAVETAREIARVEGILVGISAGANVFAAIQLAKREEFRDKNIVTVICDTGERYLSTGLFD
jgi:cysteine synthase A